MSSTTYLDIILKSLISVKDITVWKTYRHNYKHSFSGEIEEFDSIINFLESHCEKLEEFPKEENIIIGVKTVVNKSIAMDNPSAFRAKEILGCVIH